jgi:transporter family-2 protein
LPTERGAGAPATVAGAPAAQGRRSLDHGLLALIGSAFGGVLLSVQGRMNGELATVTGEPVEAAMWSFGTGLVVLTVLVLTVPAVRSGLGKIVSAVRDGSLRRWQILGGLSGGLFVATQSYAVPILGVALFTVAVVAAQTGNALVVDRFGIGPGGAIPVHWGRLLAAALAIGGVVISLSPRLGGGRLVLLPVVLALLVGGLMSVQFAINGRVNVASGQPLSTTWVNFLMGMLILGAVAGLRSAGGAFHPTVPHDVPWWAWWGGLCGIGVVSISAWSVRHLGVVVYGLAVLTGQLSAAVVLDLLTPATRGDVTPAVVIGVLVTFVAAGLATWFAWRARTATGD